MDLICNVTITADPEYDDIYANVTWYKNGIVNLSYQSGITKHIPYLSTLNYTDTSIGDNWS